MLLAAGQIAYLGPFTAVYRWGAIKVSGIQAVIALGLSSLFFQALDLHPCVNAEQIKFHDERPCCSCDTHRRSDVLRDWVSACQVKSIPCGERFKLEAVLGDPVKVGGLKTWSFASYY